MSSFPYKRIVIIGTTSSGKTTLAKYLADRFDLNFIEMDGLYWEPNWQKAPDDVFRARVEAATRTEKWAAAGNYRTVRDLTWNQADAIIWLDYSLSVIFWRLWHRTWRRWWSQEELWNGNREKLWWHFKIWSEESLFHWLFKTYWRRRREFTALLAQPEYGQVKVFRFQSQGEMDAWLGEFQNEGL